MTMNSLSWYSTHWYLNTIKSSRKPWLNVRVEVYRNIHFQSFEKSETEIQYG